MTKILLVEDSKFLRLATERSLTRAGYDVSSAGDGDEALRLVREKMPDLILLDILLPKMSGPDVLRALKIDPVTKIIPVVVMTGMSQKNAGRLEQEGAIGFLEKSSLGLDKGSEKLLAALQEIFQRISSAHARTTTA
ncbi:MAG: response regulator [Candidatus Sulfotelmatobacter sp.]